jgi:hypothetical protein
MLNGHRFKHVTISDLVYARRNRISDRRIMFLHVPKCGGTSIDEAFGRCFGLYSLLTGHGLVKLQIGPSYRAAKCLEETVPHVMEALLSYHLETQQCRYISGHFCFSNRLFARHGASWDIVTILREPASRWLSAYFYNRFKSNRRNFAVDIPLNEFIETNAAGYQGCTLVRTFIGSDSDASPRSRAGIEQAKANLSKVSTVGFVEDLDSFAKHIENRYGVRLRIPRKNVNPHKRYNEDRRVTRDLLERVKELCAPDIELYTYAREGLAGR